VHRADAHYFKEKQMGNWKKVFRAFTLVAVIALLASCFSFPGIGNPLTDALEKRANAEVASAIGISQMTRKMMFSVVYTQIFFIGGFNAAYYDLEETQGTIWRLESTDEDGKVSFVEAERALLKKLPNGDSWWFLAWRDEEQSFEFEVLFDKDLNPIRMRYYNEDVKRIEEAKFDPPSKNADPKKETTPPPKAESADYKTLDDFYKSTKAKTTKETIKITSGTWACTRIEWSIYDEDEKATYHYVWWIDTKATGGLVKFEWTKSGSKEKLKGELISIKKGYTTKFKSF